MNVRADTAEHSRRKLFCVLSARALPYAEKGVESLLARANEPVELTLITDGEADKREIESALQSLAPPPAHRCSVYSEAQADERAKEVLARYPHIQEFRRGHPCWRKITDPILFCARGEEMIILDPDLYFPNSFDFEPTPPQGLQLMWQPPSCLLPDAVVQNAYRLGVRLAHHVDIGVAQLRNELDLEWLNWFVGALGGKDIPRMMHVEAIVWAALAMRMGGGYFDPVHWNCWQYRQWKRVALKVGIPGTALLKTENLSQAKCFHASGVAKWFVKEACERNLFAAPGAVTSNRPPRPYEELTQREYLADQRVKNIVRRLGYYRLMQGGT